MARQSVGFSDVLDFTRASSAWWIDNNGELQSAAIDEPRFTEDGVLIERASTNVFLNSDAPVTQEVFVTEGDTYTISCVGTGHISLQETSSFVWDASDTSPDGIPSSPISENASEGSPLTLISPSPTLAVYVNGTLDYAQVEDGGEATSVIITSNSPVTRSADVISTKASA